jgi:cytochrome c peroxidase
MHSSQLTAFCSVVVFVTAGCSGAGGDATPAAQAAAAAGTASEGGTSTFRPLTAPEGIDPEMAELGRKLFFDKRLSHDDTIACASCHDIENGGVDHRRASVGIRGQVGAINAPTVLNSGLLFALFWNGRAATLEDQADGPPQAAGEMGSSWPEIVAKLKRDRALVEAFRGVFHDDITADHIKHSIATFERTLVTLDAPFDRYLRGDEGALSPEAKEGFRLFQDYGCVACHQGKAIGGNMFQRFGVMADYFADRGNVTDADLGRFAVTKNEDDRYVFKVPSLRNVELTAPYFHDGSAATLEDAVTVMGRYQLGRELTDAEKSSLTAFLRSLTGRQPGQPPGENVGAR